MSCPDCGKIRYSTKAVAKLAARRIRGHDGKVRPYRCGDFWHLGHQPAALTRGDISRDDVPARRAGPDPGA